MKSKFLSPESGVTSTLSELLTAASCISCIRDPSFRHLPCPWRLGHVTPVLVHALGGCKQVSKTFFGFKTNKQKSNHDSFYFE